MPPDFILWVGIFAFAGFVSGLTNRVRGWFFYTYQGFTMTVVK